MGGAEVGSNKTVSSPVDGPDSDLWPTTFREPVLLGQQRDFLSRTTLGEIFATGYLPPKLSILQSPHRPESEEARQVREYWVPGTIAAPLPKNNMPPTAPPPTPSPAWESAIQDAAHLADLARRLLLICRNQKQVYLDARHECRYLHEERQLRARVAGFFSDQSEDFVSAVRQALAHIVAVNRHDMPDVVCARAIAWGLDDSKGDKFFDMLRNDALGGAMRLESDMAIPVSSPSLADIFAPGRREANSEPLTVGMPVDQLRHMRLAPSDFRHFEITIDYSFAKALTFLEQPRVKHIRFAVAALNWDRGEFEVPPSGAAREFAVPFFPVSHKDRDLQLNRLRQVVRQANENEAYVLVLPELSLVEDDVAALSALMESFDGTLRLLVAGSYHTVEESRQLNRAESLVRTSDEEGEKVRSWSHDKFSEFSYREPGSKVDNVEQITRDRKLRLVMTRGFVLLVVICKDLLEVDCRRLADELGVTLLLVPAMTPKTQAFEAIATNLTATNQAFSVIANNPVLDSYVLGMAGCPHHTHYFHLTRAPNPAAGSAASVRHQEIPFQEGDLPGVFYFTPSQVHDGITPTPTDRRSPG